MSNLHNEEIQRMSSVINKIPMVELPRIHYEISRGRWPEILGEEIPADAYRSTVIHLVLKLIEERCGKKAILRWRKVEKEGYTPEMFEDWYDSNFVGGREYTGMVLDVKYGVDERLQRIMKKHYFLPGLTCFFVSFFFSLISCVIAWVLSGRL